MSVPRLRAPKEHGAVLAEPSLEQVGRLLVANRHGFHADLHLLGRPLTELRALARAEAHAAAAGYAASAGEPSPAPSADGWLVAGHQPELFHPGVWFKNFALHGLARRHGAFALNLVVDNDTAKSTALRVPAGEHVATVPMDVWRGEVPWEERTVIDPTLFASLPGRASEFTRGWPFRPLLDDFWAEVRRQGGRTPLLGERFAAARRVFERRWGLPQAEVPVSRLCATEAFAWFAGHLVLDAERFHTAYNDAVHDYRGRHDLRSANHPVPDLAREGDWFELPLWAWRAGEARRGRLFVRRAGADVQLRAGADVFATLPAEPRRLVDAWRSLEPRGCKVRTRAITTTLFTRLLLADLFVHGIGGGRYDELTDAMIARFFSITPPGFLILTATLLLPLPGPDVDPARLHELTRLERDLAFNPQRHLHDEPAAAVDLARQKRAWIDREAPTHDERVQRFRTLRELTDRLREYVDGEARAVHAAKATAEQQLQLRDVARRRDYAFCLYPEDMLREFYARLL